MLWNKYMLISIVSVATTGFACLVNLIIFLLSDENKWKRITFNLLKFLLMDYFDVFMEDMCVRGKGLYCNQSSIDRTEFYGGEIFVVDLDEDAFGSFRRSDNIKEKDSFRNLYDIEFQMRFSKFKLVPCLDSLVRHVDSDFFKDKVDGDIINMSWGNDLSFVDILENGGRRRLEIPKIEGKTNFEDLILAVSSSLVKGMNFKIGILELKIDFSYGILKHEVISKGRPVNKDQRYVGMEAERFLILNDCLSFWQNNSNKGVIDGRVFSERRGTVVLHSLTVDEILSKFCDKKSKFDFIFVPKRKYVLEGDPDSEKVHNVVDGVNNIVLEKMFGPEMVECVKFTHNHYSSFLEGLGNVKGYVLVRMISAVNVFSLTKLAIRVFKIEKNWQFKRYVRDLTFILEEMVGYNLNGVDRSVNPRKEIVDLVRKKKREGYKKSVDLINPPKEISIRNIGKFEISNEKRSRRIVESIDEANKAWKLPFFEKEKIYNKAKKICKGITAKKIDPEGKINKEELSKKIGKTYKDALMELCKEKKEDPNVNPFLEGLINRDRFNKAKEKVLDEIKKKKMIKRTKVKEFERSGYRAEKKSKIRNLIEEDSRELDRLKRMESVNQTNLGRRINSNKCLKRSLALLKVNERKKQEEEKEKKAEEMKRENQYKGGFIKEEIWKSVEATENLLETERLMSLEMNKGEIKSKSTLSMKPKKIERSAKEENEVIEPNVEEDSTKNLQRDERKRVEVKVEEKKREEINPESVKTDTGSKEETKEDSNKGEGEGKKEGKEKEEKEGKKEEEGKEERKGKEKEEEIEITDDLIGKLKENLKKKTESREWSETEIGNEKIRILELKARLKEIKKRKGKEEKKENKKIEAERKIRKRIAKEEKYLEEGYIYDSYY
jgi:hypothetical protein